MDAEVSKAWRHLNKCAQDLQDAKSCWKLAEEKYHQSIRDLLGRDHDTPLPNAIPHQKGDRMAIAGWKVIYDRRLGVISVRYQRKNVVSMTCSGSIWWNIKEPALRVDALSFRHLNVCKSRMDSAVWSLSPMLVAESIFENAPEDCLEFIQCKLAEHVALQIQNHCTLPKDVAEVVESYHGPLIVVISAWCLLNDSNPYVRTLVHAYPDSAVLVPRLHGWLRNTHSP